MSIVDKTKENLEHCKCLSCPSYTTTCKIKEMPHNVIDMMKGIENIDDLEGMFCAYSTSRCIDEDKGCLCSECEVHEKYDLENQSYCLYEGGTY